MRTMKYSLVVGLLVLAMATPGFSGVIYQFNFDVDAVGTATQFSDTVNGLTATFLSPADPGGFQVYSASSFGFVSPIGGNVLADPGPAGASNIPLEISFSSQVTSVSLDFAVDGGSGSPFDLTAFEGIFPVGTSTASDSVPSGGSFPQGSISFSGAAFNAIELTSPTTPYFAIDNVEVTLNSSIPVIPEPATVVLFGTGLLGLGTLLRRRWQSC